jgi:hypothetical protein
VWGSPLIHSADLRTVGQRHPECLELMLNPEVLAVNQDALGAPARLLYTTTNATSTRSLSNHAINSNNSSSNGSTRASSAATRVADVDVNSTQIVLQVWARPLSGGRVAVVMFNRGEAAAPMRVNFSSLDLPPAGTAHVRDVLKRANGTDATGAYEAEVESHGVAFVVLTPVETAAAAAGPPR